MNTDSEQALPMLEKMISGQQSPASAARTLRRQPEQVAAGEGDPLVGGEGLI